MTIILKYIYNVYLNLLCNLYKKHAGMQEIVHCPQRNPSLAPSNLFVDILSATQYPDSIMGILDAKNNLSVFCKNVSWARDSPRKMVV